MATMFARHKVQDFKAWQAAYDGFDEERRRMGVKAQGVYQADGDPNDVTVYHHFDDIGTARAFIGSDRLKEVMQGAGVLGSPEVWLAEKV